MKPGAKYFEWERKGVPVRLEVGPKDVEKGAAMAVRRDDRSKQSIPLSGLAEGIPGLLAKMQADLLGKATAFRDEHMKDVATLDELAKRLDAEPGWWRGGWDGEAATEAKVKEKTNATIRCIPWRDGDPGSRRCIVSGAPAKHTVLFARSY
jgi:prolyl-tRNA synthetase